MEMVGCLLSTLEQKGQNIGPLWRYIFVPGAKIWLVLRRGIPNVPYQTPFRHLETGTQRGYRNFPHDR